MKFLSRYFSTPSISLGFLSAITASAFIYLYHFGLYWPLLQTILALATLLLWLKLPARTLFWSGFFTGIFWFWWIGLSFRYYDLSWMIPLVIVAIGLVYALIFNLIGVLPSLFLRAAAFGLIEFFHPFGFDWFRPALLFTGSYLGDGLIDLWIILAALSLFAAVRTPLRYLPLALLILAYQPRVPHSTIPEATLQAIEPVQTAIPQDKKWDPRYKNAIIGLNLQAIDNAIAEGKKAVILPESAFPLYLNMDIPLVQKLLKKSEKITILTGALFTDGRRPYNSTYLFEKGRMKVMNKVVLVPFGEASPLPKWMGRWVNRIFFDGAEDYATAAKPYDFDMLKLRWRNAICYEATSDRLYEGNPKRMIAVSNNAWFTPSTQATLQRLLMQLQADRHGTTILHVTNGPGTGVVVPEY